MEFPAELEGMLAHNIGNVVDQLEIVSALELWPLKTTQTRKEVSPKTDPG